MDATKPLPEWYGPGGARSTDPDPTSAPPAAVSPDTPVPPYPEALTNPASADDLQDHRPGYPAAGHPGPVTGYPAAYPALPVHPGQPVGHPGAHPALPGMAAQPPAIPGQHAPGAARPWPGAARSGPWAPAAGPTGPYPPAAAHPGPVIAQFGEITVLPTVVRTPLGDMPLAGSTWYVADYWHTEQKIPSWAVVLAIVGFCVLTVFSLLFLLARETVHRGTVQVTVSNGGRQYVARIPVTDPAQVHHINNQVNYVRSLAVC